MENKSWPEEAKETLEFHENQQKIHGKPKNGRPDSIIGKRGWSARDTAKALNFSLKRVHDNLKLGELLRLDPRVADEKKTHLLINTKLSQHEFLGRLKGIIASLQNDPLPRIQILGKRLRDIVESYE